MATKTKPLFECGRIVSTSTINRMIARNVDFSVFVYKSLHRFLKGDWGDISIEDKAYNELSLENGNRILGVYNYPGSEPIWILTEAGRSCTTIMFRYEY